jgi:hypothetical protein
MDSCANNDRNIAKIRQFCKFSLTYHDDESELSQFLGMSLYVSMCLCI